MVGAVAADGGEVVISKGPTVQLDMHGLRDASDTLLDAAARGENMRPAFLKIRELLVEGHKKQFSTKGSFLGTPWEMNAPGTLARKARLGQGSEPMVATGDLRDSLAGGKGKRSRVSRSSVSVGTSLFYSVFHIRPRRQGVPARPPVGISEGQRKAALLTMENYILGRGL
jgi:hypothetical protein